MAEYVDAKNLNSCFIHHPRARSAGSAGCDGQAGPAVPLTASSDRPVTHAATSSERWPHCQVSHWKRTLFGYLTTIAMRNVECSLPRGRFGGDEWRRRRSSPFIHQMALGCSVLGPGAAPEGEPASTEGPRDADSSRIRNMWTSHG